MKSFIALMRGFTIRTRMYSAIGVVQFLLSMVGGVGMYGLVHNAEASRQYHAHSLNEIDKLSRLRDALDQMRMHEKDILPMAGDAAGTEAAVRAWRSDIEIVKVLSQTTDGNAADARRMAEHLNVLSKGMADKATRSMAAQQDNVAQTMTSLAGALVLSLIVVAPTTILQIGICRPIDQARLLATLIAQGHLTTPS